MNKNEAYDRLRQLAAPRGRPDWADFSDAMTWAVEEIVSLHAERDDWHITIRQSYDRLIADAWRARLAEVDRLLEHGFGRDYLSAPGDEPLGQARKLLRPEKEL